MGRPEPCVLFSQSFIHPHLDEYVDEVIFAEPIVITACEFLEQNASSSSPMITLVGATSPPSFALEVFVQIEGEPRFRRLCQPFLYSHSSSNVLEVEAVVTNHLVVRGSYRSLTLVVYGNTAEDLGQFNIEFDLDNSLANLVCSPAEGKLEDLPPALNLSSLTFEQSICSPKSLSLPVAEPDLSIEMKQFLHLTLKICQLSDHEDITQKLASIVASAVSSYVSSNLCGTTTWNQPKQGCFRSPKRESQRVLTEARKELLELYKMLQHASVDAPDELLGEGIILESAVDLPTPELLVDVFNHCFLFKRKSPTIELPVLSQNENMIVGLSVVLLLCSGRESCFHFVNGGGMEQLAHFFSPETQKSTAITLMLLGVVERATRYAIGCEGFLGWWPREDENVPIGSSEGYSQLLKLLLQKQRHDVASLATYILHRLRSYEITSRYESAILSVLGNLSAVGRVTSVSLNSLATANSQLKRLLKLLNLRGPIEDPSPVSSATRSLILSQSEGLLSYGATINLIASSKYCFSNWDIDTHLLSLLKERGFLPLSAALLSSPVLRSEIGRAMDIFVDIAASIEAILLSLLFCRSGLVFLLLQPEVSAAVILSLHGVDDVDKAECVPLRYAAVLISKGFICRVQEIGMVTDLHLRVVNAIDRLLRATPHSEELLWVLWELCALSRSDSGRQAVLALAYFPEAVVVLMETVRSIKELQPAAPNHGTSPLGLAIFHLASELFEIMVTDSTSSSLFAWIGHAVELHKALHSSSPGSNRKDAPMRLLEWIDAGVVYHKNGAVGLLRYAAVLASGGDAQLTSTSILVSDSMDVEKVVGDSASGSDVQVENLLGKLVSVKFFDGVPLRDSSIAQLTTTFRILAFISENSAVAAALYEEGAVTLIYVVLVNCKSMLGRYSNNYDYLVDEGAESNSTSDLLLERSREQSLIDLMIPSLVLLITLLQKLQEAKEQHRNTKLLNALLHLHREVSPKLAARAADSSSPYPCSALGLGAVCRLIVSALACWPVFSWTPGLFHCLLESVQVTSSLALGPKEACSLLCLLGDLFPEEGIWLWKNGMPSLSDLRSLSIATLLGPERERDVEWYLQPGHLSVLLSRLTPLLDKIAQIVLHFSFTALVVIQDLLRVFIIRIACQKVDSALVLLRPIISWIDDHVSKSSSVSDKEIFKVHRLLDFVASLSEHPHGKALLLKEGAVGIFIKALQRCIDAFDSDGKLIPESRIPAKSDVSFLSWCFPVFKSLALICDPQTHLDHSAVYDKSSFEKLSIEDCSLIGCNLLKLCQFLPVGRELQACLIAFKELASTSPGRSALASIFEKVQSSSVEDVEAGRGKEVEENGNLSDEYNWRRSPPLLICWKNLLRSIEAKDGSSVYAVEAVSALCLVASCLCGEGKNLEGILLLKCLFGLPCDLNGTDDYPEEKLKDVHELIALLDGRIGEDEYSKSPTMKTSLCQVKESVESMLLLLEKPVDSVKVENVTSSEGFPSSNEVTVPSKIFSLHSLMPSVIMMSTLDDEAGLAISRIRRSEGNAEKAGNYISLGGLADNFLWECPDSSPDRLSMPALPVKRKMTAVESSSRRLRGDNLGPENTGTNAFPRGLGPPTVSSGPTRRDTFRQRKPNTSRPPSMHVDDYVARERNVDGASSGSNVVNSVQRGGSTGGRPPSIHVDEFMARQRERQNPVAATVGEVAQVRSSSVENDNDSDKIDRSRQLKADLDDDLQEINIVFDEESESDDRLPFPQPDDNLPPASVIIGESSPRPIVEESENEINESSQFSHLGTPPATKTDGNLHSDLPLRRSVSRAEMPLAREPSISSEKHYPGMNSEKTFFHEQGDETKHTALLPTSKGFDASTATHLPAFPSQFYNKGPISSPVQPLGDSRPTQPAFYQDSPHQSTNVPLATGSQGFYDQKLPVNQPPLPPLPPPPAVSPIPSQSAEPVQTHSSPYGHSLRDAMPPLPTGHPLQAFNVSGPSTIPVLHVREDRPGAALLLPSASSSAFSDSLNPPFQPQIHTEYQSTAGTLLATPHPMLESKYSWATVSSGSRLQDEANPSTGSGRPPPLPPMPPPYSSPQVTQSSMKSSSSQSPLYNQTSVGIQLPLPSAPLTDSRLGAFSATSVGGSSLISYPLPPFGPPSMVARPTSIPGSLFTTAPMMQQQQQGQNTPSLSLPAPNPQPSVVQSIQARPPLQPLQPPLLRPPHLLQHHRLPSIQISQPQSEQGIPLQQSPIQVQLPPLQQIQQQLPMSQMHVYYQPQQQEHLSLLPQQLQVEQAQPQALHQQGDSASSQQQQDSGMTLQQYFSSPEAIQSLLSDRDKLCQLLEQHPKLMQMLQEKLGQL